MGQNSNNIEIERGCTDILRQYFHEFITELANICDPNAHDYCGFIIKTMNLIYESNLTFYHALNSLNLPLKVGRVWVKMTLLSNIDYWSLDPRMVESRILFTKYKL